MAEEIPERLIKIAGEKVDVHIVAMPSVTSDKPGAPIKYIVCMYLAANAECSAEEFQAFSVKLGRITPAYQVLRRRVPSEPAPSPSSPFERPSGCIQRVFDSKPGDKPAAVAESVARVMGTLSQMEELQHLNNPAIITAAKEAIGDFYNGLDGGLGVTAPAPKPVGPTGGGAARFAASAPEPKPSFAAGERAGVTLPEAVTAEKSQQGASKTI